MGKESKFSQFYDMWGKHLKMGVQDDDANRTKIAKLLRFNTTKSQEKQIPLEAYLERMPEDQKEIYFMSGESVSLMMKQPALKVFLKKDLEVLLLSEAIDEQCLQKIADFEGKKFVSVQKADLKLAETEDEKKRF